MGADPQAENADTDAMAERMSITPSPAWGVVRIYGEAGRLLRRHSRLFLPCVLLVGLHHMILETLVQGLVRAAPTPAELPPSQEIFPKLGANFKVTVLMIMAFIVLIILDLCNLPAFVYTVAHIYTVRDVGTEETVAKPSTWDIVRRLFPSALLPVFVTVSWLVLFGALLSLIVSAMVRKFLLDWFYLAVVMPLTVSVAVLEREKYGLAAVKKGFKLARRRAATVTAFALCGCAIGEAEGYALNHRTAYGVVRSLPVWAMVPAWTGIIILSSAVQVLLNTATIVLYFVCVSSLEEPLASIDVLPEDDLEKKSRPAKPVFSWRSVSEGMGKWGIARIVLEACRLLRKHFRLFLPFILVFYVPTSMVIFGSTYVGGNLDSVRKLSLQKPYAEWAAGEWWVHFSLFFAALCSGTLALFGIAAFLHVLAHIYSHDGSNADKLTIIKRVFESIPSAGFRLTITQFWISFFAGLATLTVAPVLDACFLIIRDARAPTWKDLTHEKHDSHLYKIWWTVFIYILRSTLFAFSLYVAVLEPERYGRAAIKKALRLVMGRGAAVVLEFSLYCQLIAWVPVFLERLEMEPGSTFWLFASVLGQAVDVCISVASMVMYFVCKSSLEDHSLSSSSSSSIGNEGNGNGTQSASFFWNEKRARTLKLAVKVILLLSLMVWLQFQKVRMMELSKNHDT